MGSSDRPRKRKAPFHLPPGTALDLFWQSSGQVPAPFRRRKDSPVFTHRVGAQGGNPGVLGTGGPMEERQGLGHRLCHTTAIYPTGLRGRVPAELFLVCDSEWHLHSIWAHMKPTEALCSSFRLSGLGMRMWPGLSYRKIFVCPWMRAQKHWIHRDA